MEGNLENTKKLQKNLELLYAQQMIKKSDVSKVALQMEQLLTQNQLIKSNLEQVLNALKFSMGISLQQNLEIESEILNKPADDYSVNQPVDLQIAFAQTCKKH